MSSPVYLPPTEPDRKLSRASTSTAQIAELTAEQSGKLATLLDHLNSPTFAVPDTIKEVRSAQKQRYKKIKDVKQWVGAPLDQDKANCSPLTDREKCFLTTDQCQRFLRAVKWDLPAAFSRTEETVVWRREFGVDELAAKPEMISEEAETGKEVMLGWDVENRPCLYMLPWRQNTKQSHRQIQFVVWCLERTVDLMGPGTEKLCLLIDFGTSDKGGGGQPTSLGQAKKVLDILQNYYCERLGRAVCINVPTIFWGFYRLVGPFVDPVTKDKIRFNPDVRTLVPPSQLEQENFKGDYPFVYKHDEYFPFLNKMCQEKREKIWKKWLEIGNGKCGALEADLKAEPEDSVPVNQENGGIESGKVAPAGGVAALANSTPGRQGRSPTSVSMDSPAPSIRSVGYQLPPEAETAPDWEEPASSSTPASSIHTGASSPSRQASSPSSPITPTKANGGQAVIDNGTPALSLDDKQPMGMGRPRADSNDSFHTSTEEFVTPSSNLILNNPLDQAGERSQSEGLGRIDESSNSRSSTPLAAANSAPSLSQNAQVAGTEVPGAGLSGLVIHEDGSIGAPIAK